MADIEIDYESITTLNSILTGAMTTTVPKLTALKGTVETLLGPDGGLWMDQTSPLLKAQYDSFSTQLVTAIDSISNFQNFFSQISSQMSDMDSTFATKLQSSS
jgi:hypothetical protein